MKFSIAVLLSFALAVSNVTAQQCPIMEHMLNNVYRHYPDNDDYSLVKLCTAPCIDTTGQESTVTYVCCNDGAVEIQTGRDIKCTSPPTTNPPSTQSASASTQSTEPPSSQVSSTESSESLIPSIGLCPQRQEVASTDYVQNSAICQVNCTLPRKAFSGIPFGPIIHVLSWECCDGYQREGVAPNLQCSAPTPAPTTPPTTTTPSTPQSPAPLLPCPPQSEDIDVIPQCTSEDRPKNRFVDSKNEICPSNCFTRKSTNGVAYGPKTKRNYYRCRPGFVDVKKYPRNFYNQQRDCIPADN